MKDAHAVRREPGLCIAPDADVPPAPRGIDVPIEEHILVTETGHENLTRSTAEIVAEIEKLVSAG
ncbi:MAG TPA: hypothetical protein VGP07_01985 [Polyangia bacterium]|jgi:Xaa-Pro aminopeptidase